MSSLAIYQQEDTSCSASQATSTPKGERRDISPDVELLLHSVDHAHVVCVCPRVYAYVAEFWLICLRLDSSRCVTLVELSTLPLACAPI